MNQNLISNVRILVALTLAAVVAAPAAAKKNDPNIDLEFLPQQAVAAALADLSHDMLDQAVELRVEDARPGDDPVEIGTRTDDKDRKHTLKAVNDVGPYVAEVLQDLADEWGLKTKGGSKFVLEVGLSLFKATETNQAVGATYEAKCRLMGKLRKGGKEVWEGSVTGDATRYGRKFSNANVNEVLSDALLEAFAELLSDGGLHRAWPDGK